MSSSKSWFVTTIALVFTTLVLFRTGDIWFALFASIATTLSGLVSLVNYVLENDHKEPNINR